MKMERLKERAQAESSKKTEMRRKEVASTDLRGGRRRSLVSWSIESVLFVSGSGEFPRDVGDNVVLVAGLLSEEFGERVVHDIDTGRSLDPGIL